MHNVVGINLGYIHAGMAPSFDCITLLFVPISFRTQNIRARKRVRGFQNRLRIDAKFVGKINNRLTVF